MDVGARPAEEGGFERTRFLMDENRRGHRHGGGDPRVAHGPRHPPGAGQRRRSAGARVSPAAVFFTRGERAGAGGRRALGVSGRYEIETRHGASVDTLRGDVLEGPVLTEREREAGRDAMERDAGRVGLTAADLPYGVPERRTPLNQIFYDDAGRLWVELSVTADSARVAEVWDTDGTVVERIRWPADVRLGTVSWIGERHALGVQRDELGVERVVRLFWN